MLTRIISYYLLVLLILAALLFLVIRIFAINETVTHGNAYGFNINESVVDTYKYIQENRVTRDFRFVSFDSESVNHRQISTADFFYHDARSHNQWKIQIGNKNLIINTVELSFNDNKLTMIRRYRNHKLLHDIPPYLSEIPLIGLSTN